MPEVTRLGDMCTGHGSFPSRPSTSGSPNVNVNGIPVHRKEDTWATHCDSSPSCHASELKSGSRTVKVNGKDIGRIGDPVACGSYVDTGSRNVYAGG